MTPEIHKEDLGKSDYVPELNYLKNMHGINRISGTKDILLACSESGEIAMDEMTSLVSIINGEPIYGYLTYYGYHLLLYYNLR